MNIIRINFSTRYCNAAYQNRGKQEAMVGNATAANVLDGKTFTNSSTVGATGTMPNKGAVTGSITASGGSYTIPAGYHNGSGKVTGPTLAALVKNSNVTLNNDSNLLSGVTAYGKDGVKYTGSMVNRGQLNWNPTSSETKVIQPGYYSGGTLSTEAVYKKGLEESIKGDWSLKLSFHIKAGNSSSLLSGSYVRVTLKKGIFETVLYEKDVTTFISTETVTKNLIDYSGYFNSSHKIRLELAFAGHNSGTFMGNVYAKLYFINSNGETLLHTVTTTSTTHDEHKEILIGQYIK